MVLRKHRAQSWCANYYKMLDVIWVDNRWVYYINSVKIPIFWVVLSGYERCGEGIAWSAGRLEWSRDPVCHHDYFRSHNLLTPPPHPPKLKNTSPKATHPCDIFLSRLMSCSGAETCFSVCSTHYNVWIAFNLLGIRSIFGRTKAIWKSQLRGETVNHGCGYSGLV